MDKFFYTITVLVGLACKFIIVTSVMTKRARADMATTHSEDVAIVIQQNMCVSYDIFAIKSMKHNVICNVTNIKYLRELDE